MRRSLGSAVLLALPLAARAATPAPSPQPNAVSVIAIQVSGTVQLPSGARNSLPVQKNPNLQSLTI